MNSLRDYFLVPSISEENEKDDIDELSISVRDFKKTGINPILTKDKEKLKKIYLN